MWETKRTTIVRITEGLIIGLALLFQWYSHKYGLLLTDDSLHYLAGSQSFSNGYLILDSDNNNFLFWPPLFSIFLSIVGTEGELLNWAYLVIEFAISIIIVKTGNRIITNPLIRILYLIFVALGVHLLLISTFLWSELLFLLLVLSFIHFVQNAKASSHSLWLAVLLGFLMCLQRNAGLFITVGATIWLLISYKDQKGNVKFAAIFFSAIVSGQICWNIYVWFYLPHEQFDFSTMLFQHALENQNIFGQAIMQAFIPFKQWGTLLLTLAILGLIYLLRNILRSNRELQLVFTVSIVYMVGTYAALIINIAGIEIGFGEGDRFVSIIIPFISLLVFKAIDEVIRTKHNYVKYLILLLLISWMSYPLARTIKNAKQWHKVSMETNLK